jgi:NADH dehydrogenase
MKKRVVVLGGGFAGVLAARRIAAGAGDLASVLLIAENDAFVERVRFHELAAGKEIQRLPLGSLVASSGASFRRATARSIDPVARVVHVEDPGGGSSPVEYDILVYALGSRVDVERVPGAAENALSVAAEVVVCGGGMTGVELATEIAEAHPRLSVRLLTRDPPCEPLAPAARSYLNKALARFGIEVEVGSVREVRAEEIALEGGSRRFDVCVWAASFRVSPLAKEAGISVHPSGQLEVDESLRSTSHPEVFGAGDAALPTCSVPIRMGCATAMPMAAQTAANVVALLRGRPLAPFRFAYAGRFISLGRRDALAQFVRHDDSPRSWLATGRLAAWIKEWTFRFNVFALKTGFYPWQLALVGAPRLPARPQALLPTPRR